MKANVIMPSSRKVVSAVISGFGDSHSATLYFEFPGVTIKKTITRLRKLPDLERLTMANMTEWKLIDFYYTTEATEV